MQLEAFDNTEVAFRHKSDRALTRAYWMFKLIAFSPMVSIGKRLLDVALVLRLPIHWALRWNVFEHFCGGETIEACQVTTRALDQHGVGTILDFSVEGKESDADFERSSAEILKTADAAAGNEHIPFCVFKVSGIARHELLEKVSEQASLTAQEQAEFDTVQQRVDAICSCAADGGTYVLIDAEESWIQPAIDDIALAMNRAYNHERVVVFNTYQLYRHDRLQVLTDHLDGARDTAFLLGAKLVRGAYMEKERDRAEEKGYPSPIQPDKASTDRDFDAALALCAQHIEHMAVCVGTHNERSSAKMTELMAEHGIEKSDPRVYFAQLLGMSEHISFNLAAHGYNVAKYVPYGPLREVVPYLIRRAEENTSVSGQTGRELQLIQDERRRRAAER
ncbi:MAG: proline dehydrogenase family protein [Nannocystaceae bacterium]|nr:proline dehydrogenase family protein [Nannocystaceae bacterium]